MNSYTVIFGCGLALFLLMGRWTISRAIDISPGILSYLEPRLLIAVALVATSLTSLGIKVAQKPGTRQLPSGSGHFFWVLAYLAWMLLSTSWSVGDADAVMKLYEMSLIAAVVLSTSIIAMSCSLESVLLATITCFSVIVGLMVVMAFVLIDGSRVAVLGGGPNVLARNIAMTIPALVILVLRSNRLVAFSVSSHIAISLILLIATGSRGAAVALTGSVVYFISMTPQDLPKNLARGAVLAGVLAASLWASGRGGAVVEQFQDRIIRRTIQTQYASGRDHIYADAWEIGLEHFPWGCGLGGFKGLSFDNTYPHNIGLESFAEGGLPAALLLLLILLGFGRSALISRDQNDRLLNCIVVTVVLAAQFSGDLFDSRCVFLLCPLVGGATYRRSCRIDAERASAYARKVVTDTNSQPFQTNVSGRLPVSRPGSTTARISLRERMRAS